MNKAVLLTLMIFSVNYLFSQNDSLLQKYTYRINNFRAVELYVNGSGQFYKNEVSDIYKNSSSSGSLGGSYYLTKSKDKILLNASASINGSFNRAKSDNQSVVNTNSSFAVSPQFFLLNKWFVKKCFFEAGTNISGSINKARNEISNIPNLYKDKLGQYSVAINVGFGKGRLENVTDMQNALWLYKELKEAKQLSDELTPDELIGLAKNITKGNNTRVLDSRRRTKYLLATVDNYLQEKRKINKTDIHYFNNLNDILFFAFNNSRLSGTEKFIRLIPGLYEQNNKTTQDNGATETEVKMQNKSLTLTAGLQKYLPTNLAHQNNFGASIKLYLLTNKLSNKYLMNNIITSETNNTQDIRQVGMSLFYQHAIYPNTRTIINFNVQPEIGYQSVNSDNNFYGKAEVSGNFNYFISYQTRLTSSLIATYQKNDGSTLNYNYNISKGIQLSANIGLGISL